MKAWLITLAFVFVSILAGFYLGNQKGYAKGVAAGYDKAYQEDKYLRSFEREMRAQDIKMLRAEIALKQGLLHDLENVASHVAAAK